MFWSFRETYSSLVEEFYCMYCTVLFGTYYNYKNGVKILGTG